MCIVVHEECITGASNSVGVSIRKEIPTGWMRSVLAFLPRALVDFLLKFPQFVAPLFDAILSKSSKVSVRYLFHTRLFTSLAVAGWRQRDRMAGSGLCLCAIWDLLQQPDCTGCER